VYVKRYKVTTGGLLWRSKGLASRMEVQRAEAWLAALPDPLYQEFGALLDALWFFDDRAVPPGVVRDWIEEHGGERLWWAWFIPTVESPPPPPSKIGKGKRRSCRAA